MLKSGDNLRLTRKESDFLARLSGADPGHIKTLRQLVNFVEVHMTLYTGSSPEERMMRSLLEDFLVKSKARSD